LIAASGDGTGLTVGWLAVAPDNGGRFLSKMFLVTQNKGHFTQEVAFFVVTASGVLVHFSVPAPLKCVKLAHRG
jgi:hypothetical protein